jgi:DNA-binding transcriptional LysR family regulator
LRYFLAVTGELHFGRAATRLEIAPPPLSRQIAALEEDLGVQLFDRSRSLIRLTQAGIVLQDHARQILNRLDVAFRETRLVDNGGAGRLRIAFVGSACCRR